MVPYCFLKVVNGFSPEMCRAIFPRPQYALWDDALNQGDTTLYVTNGEAFHPHDDDPTASMDRFIEVTGHCTCTRIYTSVYERFLAIPFNG